MATTSLRRPMLPIGTLPIPQTIIFPSAVQPPLSSSSSCRLPTTQTRNARFIKQARRPYMFTQLVQLSDGSTFTCRTTSPQALYRSQKDKMNNLLWQPTNRGLLNVELDEAGKLAAFRERFGRGWDLAKPKDRAAPVTATTPQAAAAGIGVGAGAPVVGADGKTIRAPVERQPMSESAFEEEFTMADLLKDYADQSGQDFTAVKAGGRKKGKK